MTRISILSAVKPTGQIRRHLVAAAALAVLAMSGASGADLGFKEDGLDIKVAGLGSFNLSWPMLMPGDKKPIEKTVTGRKAELKYANGAGLSLSLVDGGVMELRFHGVPKDVVSFHVTTAVGLDIVDGGTWTIGKLAATPFPKDKPAKPFLFQGNANGFSFTDVIGRTLMIHIPDYSYEQLQDNREWGTPIFQWQAWIPYNKDWEVHKISIAEGAPAGGAAKPHILVDRFGQTTRKDFPDKVKDEQDLKADVESEKGYYAGLKPAPTDSWGGLSGSAARLGITGTGFFAVHKHGDRWVLADPDGNAFFHLGICSFGFTEDYTYTQERQSIYEWLPPISGDPYSTGWHHDAFWHDKAFSFLRANLVRKYGPGYDPDSHVGVMVDRIRQMGFNSIGAFSGDQSFTKKHIPRVEMCGFGPELPGIRGIPDPFDDESLKHMDAEWSKSVAAHADDPLVIGYFFANEQAFEDIPRGVPQLTAKFAAKRRLVQFLKDTYTDIAAFNAAWNLHASGFEVLGDQGLAVVTQKSFADMKAYNELFLETYFKAITTTFRKYDHNHLMMGNRWQPGTANSEMLCRIAGKYMDVISINYYTLGVDQTFIARLHQWTGDKPQMWSEFNYTSGIESNVAGGGLDMKSQRQRGQAYRNYVEHAAATGYVVGTEWFTLIDQSVTGRFFQLLNGERSNSGLFNVADRPYRDMVDEVADTHREIYGVWLDGKAPYSLDDPRFTGAGGKVTKKLQAGHALGAVPIDASVSNWPGRPPERIGADRLVQGKDGKGFEAAFKVCWDERNLYVLANVSDPTPLMNSASGADLWNGDGLELFIGSDKLDQPGSLLFSDHQILLGARRPGTGKGDPWFMVNAASQPSIALTAVPSVEGTGYTLEASIPWSSLGIVPKENLELLFDLAVDDGAADGRTRQLMWSGGDRNSSDRSHWGRLQLVP